MRRLAAGLAILCVVTACSSQSPHPNAARPLVRPTVTASHVVLRARGPSWRLTSKRESGTIQGFADRASITPGERFAADVSTSASSFNVQVFRMGWYGGAEGALVTRVDDLPGEQQPAAMVTPLLHTAVAPWKPSLTLDSAGWEPGDYLLRLVARGGAESYVPLTVRAPSARGAVVLVSPTTTWQAYDTWGCCDLYRGADGSYASRSRVVSFDRPYATGNGAAEFIDRELPVLARAERLGLRLDYVTDTDLESVPGILDGAAAVISMGHDEYWSPGMRAAVTSARNSGTNVAFLGANAIYRRIRLQASPLGPDRLIVDYKSAAEDPVTATDPAAATSDWPQPPHADPESSLTGAMYLCFSRTMTAGVVTDPGSFLFSGTGVHRGTQLPHLIGPEIDAVQLNDPMPPHLHVLMHSPFPCPQLAAHADATYYRMPSGAGVFDSGTMGWVQAMLSASPTGRIITRATDNLLRAFSHSPAPLR